VALVTGANKGIGFEVSRSLAKAGMTVLLGSRDKVRGEAAVAKLADEGLDVKLIHLDLSNTESIQAAAESIESQFQKLDVLVNNAGIIDRLDGAPSLADLDAVRNVFETNFFATALVTQAMLPLLKKSESARIVNVSSGLGSLTLNSDPNHFTSGYTLLGYNASKAALNMLTVLLANELKESGILVNAANPGYTATDINGNQGHQTVEEGASETIRLALLPPDGPTGGLTDRFGVVPW
jgi:NAD(P)-dependent dehydrogenase (short-subunit alcohol dehydrogenase family)